MRSVVSFLFLTSICLLTSTHQALAERRSQVCDDGPPGWQSRGPSQGSQTRLPAPPRGPTLAPPRGPTLAPPPAPPTPPQPVVLGSNKSIRLAVVGRPQKDERKALESALTEAREQLIGRLRELKPDLRWEGPTPRELQRLVVTQRTESEYIKAPVDAVMFTTRLELEVSPAAQEDLLRHVRLETAGERQLGLLRWVLAGVVLLVAVAGYYRLDDLTKGYYSLWIRLGILGVLGLTESALFLAW